MKYRSLDLKYSQMQLLTDIVKIIEAIIASKKCRRFHWKSQAKECFFRIVTDCKLDIVLFCRQWSLNYKFFRAAFLSDTSKLMLLPSKIFA